MERSQHVSQFCWEIVVLDTLLSVEENFFCFWDPIGFFTGFGVQFQIEIVFICIVLYGIIKLQDSLRVNSKEVDIFGVKSLVIVQQFEILLFLHNYKSLELFNE